MVILVTGGNGFLGKYVVALLRSAGHQVYAPTSHETDLRNDFEVLHDIRQIKPEVIVHLAAKVGGLGFNREHPGEIFFDNLQMGLSVVNNAYQNGVKKVVMTGSVCAYPHSPPLPFKEDSLWQGYPEVTNAPFGVAKRAMLTMLEAYQAQYGLNYTYLLPANLMGPGDRFEDNRSHVIPAVIRKIARAMRDKTTPHFWGTGRATREFLFVEDAARAVVMAVESDASGAINLSPGREASIEEVCRLTANYMGYDGAFVWDTSMPDGQPRRCLDGKRAKEILGWEAKFSLEKGLRRTVDWFLTEHALGRTPGGPL